MSTTQNYLLPIKTALKVLPLIEEFKKLITPKQQKDTILVIMEHAPDLAILQNLGVKQLEAKKTSAPSELLDLIDLYIDRINIQSEINKTKSLPEGKEEYKASLQAKYDENVVAIDREFSACAYSNPKLREILIKETSQEKIDYAMIGTIIEDIEKCLENTSIKLADNLKEMTEQLDEIKTVNGFLQVRR